MPDPLTIASATLAGTRFAIFLAEHHAEHAEPFTTYFRWRLQHLDFMHQFEDSTTALCQILERPLQPLEITSDEMDALINDLRNPRWTDADVQDAVSAKLSAPAEYAVFPNLITRIYKTIEALKRRIGWEKHTVSKDRGRLAPGTDAQARTR